MKLKKRHQQKFIVVSVMLFFLWNVPFVSIFDGEGQFLGFPTFYIFIFLSWLLSIIVSFFILKKFYE